MFKKLLVAAATSLFALSAFALDETQVEKSVQLKDGSTVHVFADGKMAMEDKFGRASFMAPGQAMQTRDGQTIVMNGNEVARLDQLLSAHYTGG